MMLGNTCERHWEKQGNVYAGRGLLTVQFKQLTLFRAASAVQYFAFCSSPGGQAEGKDQMGLAGLSLAGAGNPAAAGREGGEEKQQLWLGVVVEVEVRVDSGAAQRGDTNIPWRLWPQEMFGWCLEPRVCCRVVSSARGESGSVLCWEKGTRGADVLGGC